MYVLYHGSCPDGFGAAWAIHTILGDATYIPVSYGSPLPPIPDGDTVYIVDFSYPRQDLIALSRRCDLHVIDHHRTAQADLVGLDFCTFDMERSGAVLTWETLAPEREVPAILQYVQDRDLWRFVLPDSRAINAWIWSWDMDFLRWTDLALSLAHDPHDAAAHGRTILRYKHRLIDMMCTHVEWRTLHGYRIPAVNATVEFSEVAERLCEMYPDAPFAAYYKNRNDGKQQWGLRSRNGFDVSIVANAYGGGGHAGAAGFITNIR